MARWTSAILLAGVSAAAITAARADVVISDKPTANMSCSAGVCSPTAPKAVLNVGELAGMLASGDVTVTTGGIASDIELHAPLSWAATSRLTLDAQRSVVLKKGMSVTGTGALTVTTNDGGKSGEFVIVPEQGSVQFWDLNSSLVIDNQTYTLVGDIKTLAADIAANPSGFYALAKPYDASVDGAYTSAPISTAFTGVFDGLGNAISNFTANFSSSAQATNRGLFGLISLGGTVRQLDMVNASLQGGVTVGAIGTLAGGSQGLVERCSATGSLTIPAGGEVYAGGLVGGNEGSIRNSYALVKVSANTTLTDVGGLAGFNQGTITSSYSSGKLIGNRQIDSVYLGGLVGPNQGVIDNAFSRTTIHQMRGCCGSLGGLLAVNQAGAQVTASYAAGAIKLPRRNGVGDVGGLIGTDESQAGSIATSYWDVDDGVSDPSQGAGNIANDPGIVGLTTGQLQSGLPSGFSPKVWGIKPGVNNSFPYILALPIR